MHPFRPLKPGPRTVNYQNTVLIHRPDNVWLLGYVQDINGDEFLINFDSIKTPSSWIHSQDVWPHHFISSALAHIVKQEGSADVYVALRDEEDGPYRFRPGQLLPTMLRDGLYYVRQDNAENGSRELIVHGLQITAKVPTRQEVLDGRTGGFMYVKHVIPYVNVHLLPPNVLDEYELCAHFVFLAPFGWHEQQSNQDWSQMIERFGCRFHMRVEIDQLVFISVEFHSPQPGEVLHWPPNMLKKLFETHYAELTEQLRLSGSEGHGECILSNTDAVVSGLYHSTGLVPEKLFTNQDRGIGDLSKILHMAILHSFDLHTQAKMKRVCAAWYFLLSDSTASSSTSIIIDISNFRALAFDSLNLRRHKWNFSPVKEYGIDYMLTFLVNRTVTAKTRSLTLTKGTFGFQHKGCVLVELLQLKGIKLRQIILKDWLSDIYTLEYDYDKTRFGSRCGQLFDYFKVCERLIVRTSPYNVENILRFIICTPRLDTAFGFPYHEAKLLQMMAVDLPEVMWHVLIPQLIFQSNQSNEKMIRSILLAVANNLPTVQNTVYDEVQKTVNRWNAGLKYPDEWKVIREFLNMFNGFHADGTPQEWKDVDLRELDVSSLNNLTLTAIGAYFDNSPERLRRYPGL